MHLVHGYQTGSDIMLRYGSATPVKVTYALSECVQHCSDETPEPRLWRWTWSLVILLLCSSVPIVWYHWSARVPLFQVDRVIYVNARCNWPWTTLLGKFPVVHLFIFYGFSINSLCILVVSKSNIFRFFVVLIR